MMKVPRFSHLGFTLAVLLVLGGCRPKDAQKVIAEKSQALRDTVLPVVSVEPNSFDEVAAQLDRGGGLYFYLSTEQWLAGLSQQVDSWRDLLLASAGLPDATQANQLFQVASDVVRKSGVEEISGVGLSSIAIEPGVYRNKFFMHHYPGKGNGLLWSVFGKTPHPLKALDFLPADTALAGFSDFDLAAIVEFARQEVEQSGIPEAKQGLELALQRFAVVTGLPLDELLQSLGGSAGIVLTLDATKTLPLPLPGQSETVPLPRLALFLQVKDDHIFQRVEQMMGAMPGVVKMDEADVRLRIMALPVLPQLTLRLTVAQWGDYLVLASDDQLLRDVIAAQQSGQGLKATPEFVRLAVGLPTEGNAFQVATQRFGDVFQRLQAAMAKSQPKTTPQQAALIEKLLAGQKTSAAYSVSSSTANGWLTVGKGHAGGGQMLAPLLIAPAAFAAGVALPVVGEAQKRGQATKSLSQAKQIGLACKLYAADHDGAFPPKLEALVPDYLPDAQVFISPFAPQVPMGYTYNEGLTEKSSPPETVLVEDKFSLREHQRVVVRVDGSGEVRKVP